MVIGRGMPPAGAVVMLPFRVYPRWERILRRATLGLYRMRRYQLERRPHRVMYTARGTLLYMPVKP